jgi:hypothetical protein
MRILVLLAGSLLLAACTSQSAPAGPPPAELRRWAGFQGGGASPATRVLRTIDEWTAFWRQVETPAPQALDPAKEMAVVVSMGEKRTGGYSVEIASVETSGGNLVVTYRESSPDPAMMVTQALTYPWAAAVVARSTLPVVFRPAAGSPGTRQGK